MLEGLRTDEETVQRVVTLLASGCPLQAIVHAFDLDERTVAAWQRRAGIHCQQLHERMVQQGNVTSQQIQADEIRAKGRKIIVWMALLSLTHFLGKKKRKEEEEEKNRRINKGW